LFDGIIENELKTTADEYPDITIIGPRQSGKTTLVKKFFRHHACVNLEKPELRSLALDDPKTLLLRYPAPVVFDEIQNVPGLLSWVQVAVDENPELTGGYILTGSHQLQLREAITQFLPDRSASVHRRSKNGSASWKPPSSFSDSHRYTHRNQIVSGLPGRLSERNPLFSKNIGLESIRNADL
jgi:hypothetical protein